MLGSRGIPARYGGFETFAEELSVRLVARGIDVTVFCEGTGAGAPTEHRGVRLVHVRPRAPGPLRTLAFDAQCLAAACREYDVVYMLGYGSSALCALPRLFGRQVWINMDGLEWRRSKWSAPARAFLWCMERAAFATATRLVFDNAALRDEVETRRGAAKRSSVIEYGAPLHDDDAGREVVEHFGLEPGAYYLAVARLEPENHLHEIVRAHRISGSTRPLAIVTNLERGGEYARELAAMSGPRTRILGSVYEPERLRPLRRHAHAYVHGHSVGGTNPSLLEAMGVANAVVAHDNPFNREVLGDSALYWRDEDELELAFECCDALEPDERERLRRGAFARARDRYGWERIADEYARLIMESIA
ncbi:MAG: DUF1972 domain-containing protein [Planctomycetes bacterium]|nr:DUF1972 domain-containing protein [Planctomycetota bacterium]